MYPFEHGLVAQAVCLGDGGAAGFRLLRSRRIRFWCGSRIGLGLRGLGVRSSRLAPGRGLIWCSCRCFLGWGWGLAWMAGCPCSALLDSRLRGNDEGRRTRLRGTDGLKAGWCLWSWVWRLIRVSGRMPLRCFGWRWTGKRPCRSALLDSRFRGNDEGKWLRPSRE